MFHVSLLKEFVAGEKFDHADLPKDFHGAQPVVRPLSILDSRVVWRDGAAEEQLLVRWSNSSPPSWEPAAEFRHHYPSLNLEDKVVLNGGGVDTSQDGISTVKENDTEEHHSSGEASEQDEEPKAPSATPTHSAAEEIYELCCEVESNSHECFSIFVP